MSDEDIIKQVKEFWKQAYDRLSDSVTELNEISIPDEVKIVNESIPFGGYYHDGTIILNEEVINNKIPLQGIVDRICFQSVFQHQVLCNECVEDISNEFARQGLHGQERQRWEKLWADTTGKTHVEELLYHDPSKGYLALEDLTGSKGFESILRDLANVNKYGIEVSFKEYLIYFQDKFKDFSTILTKTELQIINYLLSEPSIKSDEIAKRLSITHQWVSTRMSDLQKKWVLRYFERVRFSRIGIRMFHLLMGSDSNDDNPRNFIASCPFIYSVSPVLTGPWQLHVVLAIPDNPNSIHATEDFLKAVQRWGIRTQLNEVISSGMNCNFDYYSPLSGEWNIPWDLERVQMQKIYDDGLASAIPRIDEPKPRIRRQYDEIDMKMIDLIWKGRQSISKLREQLHVGQQRIARKMKRLRTEGIVEEKWEVHHVGLYENIFVSTLDSELAKAIAAWALRLPNIIVSFDLNNQFMMLASLPKGGSFGLVSALRGFSSDLYAGLLGPLIHGGWKFPLELWSASSQRWLFPEEQIKDWFESIR